MRMPYQRTGSGPNPKIAGIWNAMAPGDANMTTYDTFPDAVRPRNAEASETVEGGGGGRIRTCTSFRTEPFKGSTAAVTSRPRGSDCIAPEKMEAAAGFEPAHNGFAVRSLNHLGTPPYRGRTHTYTTAFAVAGFVAAPCVDRALISATPSPSRIAVAPLRWSGARCA